ncbi:ATP-dependent 6-phosphofructokinase, partial [Mesorhizobium sp. M8A.F.Ca.ET.173.01.1.1]
IGVGIRNNELTDTSFEEIFRSNEHKFDFETLALANQLSI